jgi:hypothetical protein
MMRSSAPSIGIRKLLASARLNPFERGQNNQNPAPDAGLKQTLPSYTLHERCRLTHALEGDGAGGMGFRAPLEWPRAQADGLFERVAERE